jgi:hypothetical protein
MISPAVGHELAITTAYEKSLAIFSGVAMPPQGTMIHEHGLWLSCTTPGV